MKPNRFVDKKARTNVVDVQRTRVAPPPYRRAAGAEGLATQAIEWRKIASTRDWDTACAYGLSATADTKSSANEAG